MEVIVMTPEQLAALVEKAAADGAEFGANKAFARQVEDDRLLNKKQAAKFLGVTVSTLDKWRGEGIIQWGLKGNAIRFKKSDLLTFDPELPPRY